ncbi:MAG: efflux RND transporter permease subunit [Verrucomicrobiota bacterium]
MAKFFIDRPVFAWVVSLLIILMGCLSILKLPVAQYPRIAPPSISVTSNYAGASSETLQDTVTSIIEQQLNGIDNLLYMTATSDATGLSVITLYFQPGTDPDMAQVQVQNKVQLATPSLPVVVQQAGIVVAKATRNYMLICSFSTENGSMDELAMGNYVASHVLDPIRRVTGVGEANMFGSEYAMRIWLDPVKLNSFGLMPGDVANAIAAQNTQVPMGQVGGRPAINGQELNVIMQGRATMRTVEEFQKILLRSNPDGSRVYLRDVARIALGGQDYGTQSRVNGRPSASIAVKLASAANALDTADAVRKKIADLSKNFPPAMRVDYPLDTTTFVRISIEEVVKTLVEAMALVFLVMYLFLQNLRATFIPTIVVPIALLGTFGMMAAFGFSINTLTMFAMVLAIGILVDDAIVVIENVERIMSEEGLSPRAATRKAMEQITGALIGITLVLTAVFIPMAFFGGSVGVIYRQFSFTLIVSMLFSVFLAMSLTPALCAALLPPVEKGHHHEKGGFFGWFNRSFHRNTTRYQGVVARILKHPLRSMALFLLIAVGVGWLYARLPSSFLPEEDQGYFLTNIQLPVGATQERTTEVIKKVEAYYQAQPEIETFLTVAGFSFNGRGQNSAFAFVRLKDWKLRPGAAHSVQSVIKRAFGAFMATIKDAIVFPLNPPAINELGNATGFDLQLEDVGSVGHGALMQARSQIMALAATDPRITGLRAQCLEDAAQIKIKLDEDKATTLGLSLGDINVALSTAFGSNYINNFVDGPRVQRVIAQLDAPFRMSPEDIGKVFVRNAKGTMVPASAFASWQWAYGAPQLQRYNGLSSIELVGNAPPGRSTGEAMAAMEEIMSKMPKGIGYEWTGQSYEERLTGSQAPALYALSVLIVFLCLAALYESWSIPFAVILVVPLGIIGALVAVTLRGLPNDVYFKVGLLTVVGLSTKNAILIIEFAIDLIDQGKGLLEATLEAVHLRLRPILMTSFAFILGVLPLAISHGAGSGSQNAIGTGVIGGMLTATFLAIFLVPVFFVVVMRLFHVKHKHIPSPSDDSTPSEPL